MARTASSGRYPGARTNKNKNQDNLIRYEFLGILFYGIAALLVVIMIMSTNEFTPLYSVKQFLKGLFGSMLWSAPIWAALTGFWILRAKGDKKRTQKCVLTTLIAYLFALTMTEAFFIETVISEMKYTSYMNFMSFAFKMRIGAGAIGGLIAWPFYSFMGKLGVILLSLFAIILTLFAAGVFSIERMMDMISEKRADAPKEDGSKKTLLPKREQPKTRETAYAPRPDKKRTDVFEVSKKSARKPHSPITRIYDEPILDAYSVNTKAPVRLPNLTNDGREIERTPLGKQKGAFEVPTVSGAKDRYQTQAPSKKKPAAKKPSAKSSAASAPKKPVDSVFAAVQSCLWGKGTNICTAHNS